MSRYFFIKIEGAKQGVFQSEGDRGGIVGLGFEQAIASPRDVATGQASGKRQYSPVVFTKEWGAASPQLFQALVTNESLKNVQFDFYEPSGPEGGEELFFTVKLMNAFVLKLEKYENFNAAGHQDANDPRFLEDVSLNFQKIEVIHVASKIGAADVPGT